MTEAEEYMARTGSIEYVKINPITKGHMDRVNMPNIPDEVREFTTKDSGEREKHDTGAVRDIRIGKGRYDLLSPLAMRRKAQLYERGALKYEARNWEKGMPLSRYFDSGLRHAFNYLEGMRDEDHLAAIGWNFDAMIHTEEMIKRGLFPKEFDDMPSYMPRNINEELKNAS